MSNRSFLRLASLFCMGAAFTASALPQALPEPPEKISTIINIENAGFKNPESIIYDSEHDVYLMSNVNRGEITKNRNGFISRISPAGRILNLQWVADEQIGGAPGVVLNAPKGLAIANGALYAADIDVVRKFDLNTGTFLKTIAIPGVTFLNDLAADKAGNVYASEIGITFDSTGTGTPHPSGKDAIYKISTADQVTALVPPAPLGGNNRLNHPNGLAVLPNGKIEAVSFDPFNMTRQIYTVDQKGVISNVTPMPAGLLDGVIAFEDGSVMVSSWESKSVYYIKPGKAPVVVISGFDSPSDIGWDAKRKRLLVPQLNTERLTIIPLDGHQ